MNREQKNAALSQKAEAKKKAREASDEAGRVIPVVVAVAKRKDLNGRYAAGQHWPDGSSERNVNENELAMLKRTSSVTLIAEGDESVELWRKAQKSIAENEIKIEKLRTPEPHEPGSPAVKLGGGKPDHSKDK